MRRTLRVAAFAAAQVVVLSGAFAPLSICSTARAQDYPLRTVTLVVPYPPGGGVDAMARVVAEKLSNSLGQQVVVDNRAGGSGLVGTRTFIKSAPDGYTLFLGHTGSISINPSLYANAGFDPRRDFAPIGLIASMPVALLAHPSFPGKTTRDVVTIANKESGRFNIGTSAVGTGGYLSAELFKAMTGIEAVIIPYEPVQIIVAGRCSPGRTVGLAVRNRHNPVCYDPYPAPAAIGNAADRLRPWANFKRLWTVQTMAHSPRTFSKPRNRNWRKPRACLICPNTGSGSCLRSR